MALICCWAGALSATPWLESGDVLARHDVQLLSDAGILRAPLTNWPLAWAEIGGTLNDHHAELTPALAQARSRLLRRYRHESRTHEVRPHLRLAAAVAPLDHRGFGSTPREGGELEAGIDWTGDVFAYRLQMTAVDAPDDDKAWRYDGTYLAAIWGNWAWSVGAMERWWGPGWEGSLILSNNARPIPAISLQRHYAEPFETPWLSWLGPWQFLFTLGQMESDREIADALFLGMRFTMRPTPALEIGLSRTAQWGGAGRPEDFDTFTDLLLGKDNRGSGGISLANEPGNQLGGFDMRWQSPLFTAPYAIYGQIIGEDEAGGWPSKYLGLAGIETWGAWGDRGASWRAHLEYADTACGGFTSNQPQYGCAYGHGIYTDGYTYQGRVIGHSVGGDGRMLSLGLLFVTEQGRGWEMVLRHGETQRNKAVNATVMSVDLGHRMSWHEHELELGLGLERSETSTASDSEGRVSLQWRWRY